MKTIVERAKSVLGNPAWPQNWAVGGLEYDGEIMDPDSRSVWLCQQPISMDAYEALELPPGFIKSGIGRAEHDAAYFRHPPEAQTEGPLETLEVGDSVFSLVAKPGQPEPGFEGVTVLTVYKAHSVMFAKGRTIEILRSSEGDDYVLAASGFLASKDASNKKALPEGWTERVITLTEDLVVEIPHPARICIFQSGDLFHGPVKLDI